MWPQYKGLDGFIELCACVWAHGGHQPVDILALTCAVGLRVYIEVSGLPSRASQQVKWLVLKRGMSVGPWGTRGCH